MTQSAYWPKAFGISCAIHLVLLLLLGFFLDNLPDREMPAKYIVIDLTLAGGGGGGGGGGGDNAQPAFQPIGEPLRTAAPVPVHTASQSPLPVETSHSIRDEAIVTASVETLTPRDAEEPASTGTSPIGAAATGGTGSGSGGGIGSGVGTGVGSGSGSGSGSGIGSGIGSGVGSGIGAGSGPGLNSAIAAFLAEVEKHKEYPYIARRRGQEGVVTVFVELSTDGELRQVTIEKSSGVSQLDEAAVSAIRRVSSFYHGLGRPVAMKIPISYQLLP